MLWKVPEAEMKHVCKFPKVQLNGREEVYFECDNCGKDWRSFRSEHGGWFWRRVRFWNRKKLRRRVGIDERCMRCGWRSYQNYCRWVDAQKRAGGAVQVNHLCKRHELTIDDIPEALLGHPFPPNADKD